MAGLNRGSSVLEPGQKWNANSTDYILLGMAIEIATNRRLGDLYSTRIFKPLGMNATSYLAESPKAGAVVDGYYTSKKLGQNNVTGWNLSQGGAAGGIVSTAVDVAKYVEALATGELFEKAATLQEMLDFEALGDAVLKGYGLGIAEFNTAGFESWGHDGKTPGFQSVWFYVPDAKTTVVFLTNSGTCQAGLLPLLAPATLFTPVQ
ncbi:MAG: beta-lactamase family protein [Anaerolineales bacterium]|nr:beta-lactamase family protein [Anaerolineales bacterium]